MSAVSDDNPAPPAQSDNLEIDDLQREIGELRRRLVEADDTLHALRNGEIDAIVVGEDIYTLEGAESASNRFRSDVLAQMDDAVVVTDSENHLIYLNPAAEQQYDMSASLALGMPRDFLYRLEWIEADDEEQARDCLQEVGHWRGRNRHLTNRGETLLVDSTWSRLQDQHSSDAGTLIVIRDVSKRAAADAALRESRARLAFALESARIGEWEIDLATGIARRSARHDQCFGYAEPVGDWSREIFLHHVHPDDCAEVGKRFDQAIAEPGEMHFECRVIWPDASVHWIEVHGSVFDDESKPGRLLGTVADITARKRDEAALHDADQRKDEFLATLAHELRNPLAPIRNSARVMKLSDDAQTHQRALAVIERQLDQLVHLVDDLLDVSRISQGKIALRRELIDMAAVVENAVDTSQPLIDAKGHRLTIELPGEPVMVDADMTRLTQVLSNLLNNAARYTPDGGLIGIGVTVDEGWARLTVSDSGIGIASSMLPNIFDMFTQGDRVGDHAQGGLGIGLALVRQLVEMHAGTVECRSAGENAGTSLIVRLPVAGGEPAPLQDVVEPPASVVHSDRSSVLVVDDNHDVGDSLAELLEIVGYVPTLARSGIQAIELAMATHPQIALIDIGLPDIDGHEVARRLRADPDHGDMMLIALTGWGQEDDRRRSQQAGFDAHLVKPVDIDRLLELLQRAARQPSD